MPLSEEICSVVELNVCASPAFVQNCSACNSQRDNLRLLSMLDAYSLLEDSSLPWTPRHNFCQSLGGHEVNFVITNSVTNCDPKSKSQHKCETLIMKSENET